MKAKASKWYFFSGSWWYCTIKHWQKHNKAAKIVPKNLESNCTQIMVKKKKEEREMKLGYACLNQLVGYDKIKLL